MSGSFLNSFSSKPEFSIRIVVCDYYLTRPVPGLDVIYSDFRGADIKQVPILRIFGSTPEGRKACLHVHGVFPYFYVPCPTPNPAPQILYQIAVSLDKALNIALKQATSANQHVYKISLVKGLPFYGFHDKDHLYLKIFLYNPGLIKQAVELCSNGTIMGQPLQPHESHLNFTLQFFIDFNLFGMSNIDLQNVKYRKPNLSQSSKEPIQSPDEYSLKPESSCFYEVDCVASHIINRRRIGKGDGIENPGLEEVWNQEMERRRQLNISLGSKSLTQGRITVEETDTHYKFQRMFLVKLSNLIDMPDSLSSERNKELNEINYPAESAEDSQFVNAVDVNMHLPETVFEQSLNETLKPKMNQTVYEEMDETLVDENIASNLSLHYSQISMDNEDLDLVNILHDMDEASIEEDSIMNTPADKSHEEVNELDDAEYSQVFNEDTILLEPYKGNDNNENGKSLSWNDSFWDGVNIAQLDGACDDEHLKKVKKRKKRTVKREVSNPKLKKRVEHDHCQEEVKSLCDSDEINSSIESVGIIKNLPLKRSVKVEPLTLLESSHNLKQDLIESSNDKKSIVDLVNKISVKHENSKATESYDMKNNYVPVAGPSNYSNIKTRTIEKKYTDCPFESSPEANELDIVSFYDKSKIFDLSLDTTAHDVSSDNITRTPCSNNSNAGKVNEKSETNGGVEFKDNNKVLTPIIRPPTKSDVASSLLKYNIPVVKNPEPFYSNYKDAGDKVEIGHMVLKLQSRSALDQKPFDKILNVTTIEEWRQLFFLQHNDMPENATKPYALKQLLAGNRQCILEPVKKPPTSSEVVRWLENKNKKKENLNEESYLVKDEIKTKIDDLDNSQAIGLYDDQSKLNFSLEESSKDISEINSSNQITMQPDGSFLCFGSSENQLEHDSPVVETDYLTIMLTEVLTSVRGVLCPDPAQDAIEAIFVTVTNDCPAEHFLKKKTTEIFVVDNETPKVLDRCVFGVNITYVDTENELLERIIDCVKLHDPDILCGYEMELSSWGYILERSQFLGLEMVKDISRITEKYRQKRGRSDDNSFEGKIIGRITFSVWRLFRHELALSSYSFENCMYEILKERVPKYDYSQLAQWWKDKSRILRWIPVEYYLTKLSGTIRILEKLDFINRTSELARLFGLQWWEVLSRGSQFRVESLMLRAARPLNLVALSPTVKQRASMRAPECLPLIFEPESRFYSDPVIVLDFQSLYPSMMIAYNYCFSTCIGRVQSINSESAYEFGAWRLRIPKAKLEKLVKNELVHWSPVGVGFVKSSVRRGVLPALLRRILAARQAVKKNMKLQTDENIKKAMHSRQLGLKLIANVTYGYTAANFSGRMPCVEVGDSVVAKGRETLERAIQLVKNNPQWNAKVVYGDTDSMFVLMSGSTRAHAFAIGQQIADAVTADNPSPVALKLEKVYQPCILQTKKRYVGYMYESPEQEEPVYEAKGIETVRRDGCPAGVKLLQRALCELFGSGDMSAVKRGVTSSLAQLADGKMPLHQLFFTREYHGPTGYRPGAAAPPNEIAKRLISGDPRSAPLMGERVAWAVCAGPPNSPLVRLARSAAELANSPAEPHVAYYVHRVLLSPLHRCLSLLGVNVFKWWSELGYTRDIQYSRGLASAGGIARYLWRERCAVCGSRGTRAVCRGCLTSGAVAALTVRDALATHSLHSCLQICASCSGHSQGQQCVNSECPALWRRKTALQQLHQIQDVFAHLPPQFTEERLDF